MGDFIDKAIVAVIKGIITQNEKLLIVKRSDTDDIGAETWEIPGGKLDFGELPEEALIREIQEEVGIAVSVNRIAYVSSFMSSPSRLVANTCDGQ